MNTRKDKRITETQARHIAHLARLELTAADTGKFVEDINNILEYVDKLKELNTNEVDPTFQTAPLVNVFREDDIKESLATQRALSNAPQKDESCFLTPGIMSGK